MFGPEAGHDRITSLRFKLLETVFVSWLLAVAFKGRTGLWIEALGDVKPWKMGKSGDDAHICP